MKILFFVIILVAFCICTIGCDDDSIYVLPDNQDPETCLSGDTLHINAGNSFDITFFNSGANGQYYWNLTNNPSDELVEYLGYRTEETNPGLFGSPINQIWDYHAIEQGTTCAMFEYKRAFPEDAPALETKSVVLIIE